MLLDRKTAVWAAWAGGLGAFAGAAYMLDAPRHIDGPAGSTTLGLILGSAAYLIMLFCAALSLKRRAAHWRVGKAQTWLRAHIWLGLLTVWLIALHGAFRAGGPLTTGLWVLAITTTLSGAFGIMLQQFVPRILLHSLPGETVAQQVDDQLADAAEQAALCVGRVAGVRKGEKSDPESYDLEDPPPPLAPFAGNPEATAAASNPAAAQLAPAAKLPRDYGPPAPGSEPMRRFYLEAARPYLSGRPGPLDVPSAAEAAFSALRRAAPQPLHESIDELEHWCRRRRALLRQKRWTRVLHGWLIIHVPASWAFIVAVAVHAVQAIRYWGGRT